MVEGETPGRTVFRLLELIALLLPVVAILVQVSMNTYREQEDSVRPGVRFSTLLLLVGGILALFVSVHELTSYLQRAGSGFAPAVLLALTFIEVGLGLVGVSVVFLASPLLLRAGAELGVSTLVVVPDPDRRQRVAEWISERFSVTEVVDVDETVDGDHVSDADENPPDGGDSE